MRRYRKRLYAYGLLWGILSFGAGIATTLLTLPDKFKVDAIPEWKMATWVWLNAHGVPIAEQAISGSVFDVGMVNLIRPNPELHMLRVVPLFLTTIATVLVVNGMKGARSDSQLLEYSIVAAGGYVIAGLTGIVLTEARPGIGMIFGLIVVLGLAAYLGSMVANSLPIPVFAVTSIGGIVAIGLFAILGIGAVLTVVKPLGKYAIAGGLAATVAVWVGNNVDV